MDIGRRALQSHFNYFENIPHSDVVFHPFSVNLRKREIQSNNYALKFISIFTSCSYNNRVLFFKSSFFEIGFAIHFVDGFMRVNEKAY